jgi:hypothetical protein
MAWAQVERSSNPAAPSGFERLFMQRLPNALEQMLPCQPLPEQDGVCHRLRFRSPVAIDHHPVDSENRYSTVLLEVNLPLDALEGGNKRRG